MNEMVTIYKTLFPVYISAHQFLPIGYYLIKLVNETHYWTLDGTNTRVALIDSYVEEIGTTTQQNKLIRLALND